MFFTLTDPLLSSQKEQDEPFPFTLLPFLRLFHFQWLFVFLNHTKFDVNNCHRNSHSHYCHPATVIIYRPLDCHYASEDRYCKLSKWRQLTEILGWCPFTGSINYHHHHHHHLSLNHKGSWGTTDDFARFKCPPFFPVLHCPLGLAKLQACPFPDVVFPPLPLSALSSSPFHCALQDGFGQTWWMGDMAIPLQFASHYNGQDVFMWSNCLLDLGTDFLAVNIVFVWDA